MNYSKEVEEVIKLSKEIAINIRSKSIKPEHLFLAMIDDDHSETSEILRNLNLNIGAIKQTIRELSTSEQPGINTLRKNASIPIDSSTEKILTDSAILAKKNGNR